MKLAFFLIFIKVPYSCTLHMYIFHLRNIYLKGNIYLSIPTNSCPLQNSVSRFNFECGLHFLRNQY